VAAFELRCGDALAVLCVFAASVECESFHGLPFVLYSGLPFPRGRFERNASFYSCKDVCYNLLQLSVCGRGGRFADYGKARPVSTWRAPIYAGLSCLWTMWTIRYLL
jgi:hypothetical protein